MFVGPGQTEDQIQPVADSDRVSTTHHVRPGARVSARSQRRDRELREQPEQPQLSAARLRERLHDSRANLAVHGVGTAGHRRPDVGDCRLHRQQGHNLFLRSVANQITGVYTNPNPANARRRRAGVLDRHGAGCGRQPDGGAEPVRGDRLQDQRRLRQLQRDATRPVQTIVNRPDAQPAVHAVEKLRQHQRVQRGADRRQPGAEPRRLRLRPRLQQLRRAAQLQHQRALSGAVRARPRTPGNGRVGLGARWLGRRRHRQRAQRPADRRPHHASGRRLP